ncbi:unnamed protein product [Angiostrongylus costaricensis]|uniref:PAZ domain-containing protein n=1 Tax=Angiostrongylus costaricensis TaxID=334426 RepID=A0A158PI27_ANGCS|nr:unnamed protein product [Angiostrongylus costaricensis]
MDDDAERIRVVIKKVTDNFQITSNDVPKAVSVRGIERDKCVLEVLNLAVSHEGYREISNFVAYGSMHYLYDHRSFDFSDNVLPELMDGKYMGVGLLKSVKVLEGDDDKCSPFVVRDVAKGAFHADEQNLLEKICQVSIFVDRRTGSSNFSVQTTFRPNFIRGILRLIKDGMQYTVEQYFMKYYNIQLKCPTLFTVSERGKPYTYYPLQLLAVAPSQRVTERGRTLDDDSAIIKAILQLWMELLRLALGLILVNESKAVVDLMGRRCPQSPKSFMLNVKLMMALSVGPKAWRQYCVDKIILLNIRNWLSENGVLFVGLEICNPTALSKMENERGATYKMPSVLGCGTNCCSNPQQFIGDYIYVEARQSDNIPCKRASEQNIPSGTVVYTMIVSRAINEFYLNAHSAFQELREYIPTFRFEKRLSRIGAFNFPATAREFD